MGFGHRVYRAEDPRSRILKRVAQELGSSRLDVAEALEEAALAALRKLQAGLRDRDERRVLLRCLLDVAEVPPDLTPAMFACSRVAGWAAHILEQKQHRTTDQACRPQYIGPAARSLSAV